MTNPIPANVNPTEGTVSRILDLTTGILEAFKAQHAERRGSGGQSFRCRG
ncbi:MAG TPA: hypothetical protein PLE48_16275 [Thiobacillus sp.]|nr:hypothetical protein [Thiobacillus sp.]HQT71959.1 hypothetical protein [Thiobacillus sp.]